MQTTLSLDEIVKSFLAELDVQPATKSTYSYILKAFYRWAVVNTTDFKTLTKSDLLKYKQHLQHTCSGSTANLYFVVLKEFFAWLFLKGFHPDIAKDIKKPVRKKGLTRMPLTKEQARALLHSVDLTTATGPRDYLIIELLLTAGLRIVEVNRLKICDVYFEADKVFIKVQPKGATETNTFREITAIYPKIQEYLKGREKLAGNPAAPLFLSESRQNPGAQLSKQAIRKLVKKHLTKIGISEKSISPHSLRHTQAQILLKDGFTIYEVQQHLGHSRTATTEIYLRYAAEQIKKDNKTGKYLQKVLNE